MPAPHHGGMHFSHRFLPTARAALLALACTLSLAHAADTTAASSSPVPASAVSAADAQAARLAELVFARDFPVANGGNGETSAVHGDGVRAISMTFQCANFNAL